MDTNKMRELKELAEATGSDEWYAAGDLRYCDDKTGETHGLHHDDSRFIAAASPATVLALLAEIEQLAFEPAKHSRRLIDQLKAENEVLRSGRAIRRLTCAEVREAFNQAYYQPREIGSDGEQCRAGVLAVIDAAMAKEASHG